MIEVEVKLPVSDLDALEKKLEALGFAKAQRMQERDTYFDTPEGKIRKSGQAIRVRQVKDLDRGNLYAQINFKGQKLDALTMTRKELETKVQDPEMMRQILEGIGFVRVLPEVKKERLELKKEDITACLDRVADLGYFLELEMVVGEALQEQALSKIGQILTALGYKISDTTRHSYLTLLQQKMD